jgi:hypothetical protein
VCSSDLLQLVAGLANLLLLAPVWMQLLHLVLADLTWIALAALAARVHWPVAPSASEAPAASAA